MRAALREARYRELAASPRAAATALHYLRTELSAATDHSDPDQVRRSNCLCVVTCGWRFTASKFNYNYFMYKKKYNTNRLLKAAVTFQVAHFHKLATVLFSGSEAPEGCAVSLNARRERTLMRRRAAVLRDAHGGDMAQALAAVSDFRFVLRNVSYLA